MEAGSTDIRQIVKPRRLYRKPAQNRTQTWGCNSEMGATYLPRRL